MISIVIYYNGSTLKMIGSDGTSISTNISAGDVFGFTHGGKSMILVAYTTYDSDSKSYSQTGRFSVYDTSDLSSAVAAGSVASGFRIRGVTEFRSNIVLSGEASTNAMLIELGAVVNTYSHFTGDNTLDEYQEYRSGALIWNGMLVASFTSPYRSDNTREYDFVTMNTFGHISGHITGFDGRKLEMAAVSGGQLYIVYGTHDAEIAAEDPDELGIYRLPSGSLSFSDAVQITHNNTSSAHRDGKGGLYYSLYEENSQARYIYH